MAGENSRKIARQIFEVKICSTPPLPPVGPRKKSRRSPAREENIPTMQPNEGTRERERWKKRSAITTTSYFFRRKIWLDEKIPEENWFSWRHPTNVLGRYELRSCVWVCVNANEFPLTTTVYLHHHMRGDFSLNLSSQLQCLRNDNCC